MPMARTSADDIAFQPGRRQSQDPNAPGETPVTDFITGASDDPRGVAQGLSAQGTRMLPGPHGSPAPEIGAAQMQAKDRFAFTTQAAQTQRDQEAADAAEREELGQATRDFQQFDPFTDETLDKLTSLSFAKEADAAAEAYMQQMGGVQQTLGAAGITGGGVAAGLAAQAAHQRFQSIVTGQRNAMADLKGRQLEMRAAKKMAEYDARSRYAAVLGKDVPTTTLEAFQNLLELDLANLGIYTKMRADKDAAKDMKRAGNIGAITGLATGALSAIL